MNPRHGSREAAFSGEGARLFGGRWNSVGVSVVYSSSSLALAALETLAHADKRSFQRDYVAFRLELLERFIEHLPDSDLPPDWQRRAVSEGARQLGDRWLAERRSAVLSVPSVIVPVERNYLLNPRHPDFSKLVVNEAMTFRFDGRLSSL